MSTAPEIETVEITEPGVYEGLPEAAYHADPVPAGSLSASGAKVLLPPGCPAMFLHRLTHPRISDSLDLGSAAHTLVLGTGWPIGVVDAEDWRTKKAQTERKEIRDAGQIPLLRPQYDQVTAMADALLAHPIARVLLRPEGGLPEASLFWTDQRTGIMRRARLDWLPRPSSGRLILVDYKTSVSADPARFGQFAADYGYHIQEAWYLDAAEALELGDDPALVFVVQEKTPPYLVSVVQLDAAATRIGRALGRKAIDIYQRCVESGEWPGYADDVVLASLPPWYERQHEEDLR